MNTRLEFMQKIKELINKKENIYVGLDTPTDTDILWIKPDLINNMIDMYLFIEEEWTLMEGSVTIDLSSINNDIIPSEANAIDLGSEEKPFRSIYVDEAKISANTLYIDGVPVLGSNADTILVKADQDQGIQVGTTGTGTTKIQSEANSEIITTGVGGNINIKTTGSGGNISLTSAGNINLTAENIISESKFSIKSLTILDSLVVSGTTTTVDSVNVSIKDNIIELNSGEIGNGVTLGQSGIKINRGDLEDVFIVYDESDNCFKVGTHSELKKIITSGELDSIIGEINTHDHENIEILNNFSKDEDGSLLYNNERVGGVFQFENIEW